jgi:hypothetical protein
LRTGSQPRARSGKEIPLRTANGAPERCVEDSWLVVARAAAAAKRPEQRRLYGEYFYGAVGGFKSIPGECFLSGAGNGPGRYAITGRLKKELN